MKKKTKVVLLIAALLIVSSVLALTVAMLAISHTEPKDKPYEESTPDKNETDSHLRQIIKEKFDVYTKESLSEDNTIILFVGNSYHQLHDLKFNNKLDPLTYDEIVYLINDTIDLYFRYDYIQYDEIELKPRRIKTYHGDFTEYSYSEGVTQYQIMKNDIYYLILYRLKAFDSRFRDVKLYGNDHTPTEIDFVNIFIDLPLLAEAQIAVLDDSMANVSHSNIAKMMLCRYYGLAFDKIANPPAYDYDDTVIDNYSAIYVTDSYSTKENEKILYIAGNGKTIETLYPTKQILDRCPKKENHKADRTNGEEFVAKWMPDYNLSLPTPSHNADAYLYFIKKGMPFEEVVRSFGIPYDGPLVGTTYVGRYVTSENQVLRIWFHKNQQNKWEVYDFGIFRHE